MQVYISYGPKSNADLLLLYGFCLDRNPFNSVEIKVGSPLPACLHAGRGSDRRQNG